jgi:hypothetical protein
MDDDFVDSYIELKMEEVMRFTLHPHPVEFDMYYKRQGKQPPVPSLPFMGGTGCEASRVGKCGAINDSVGVSSRLPHPDGFAVRPSP